jgi:hypothetical protein
MCCTFGLDDVTLHVLLGNGWTKVVVEAAHSFQFWEDNKRHKDSTGKDIADMLVR